VSVLALDTDVVVAWLHEESERHRDSRRLIERELGRGARLGLTGQVVFELLHVVTDRRRFERPLPMGEAAELVETLWSSPDVERVPAPPTIVGRTLGLLREHRLGRQRILDTALVATLDAAGIRRLATWNATDYRVFGFLQTVPS
jgi:predicted nucleic acid-binding protein